MLLRITRGSKVSGMILGLMAGLTFGQSRANAGVIASDTFDYADGSLNGNNGGTGFIAAWGDANGNAASTGLNSLLVSGGTAIFNPDATGSVLSYRALPSTFNSTNFPDGVLWMRVDEQSTGPDFFGVSLFSGTTERAYIGRAGTDWAINRDAGGGTSTTSDTLDTFKTGVAEFDLNSGTASLWVGSGLGPVDVSGTPDAVLDGFTLAGIDTLRIGGGDAAGTDFKFDNLVFGTTAADVNNAASSNPSSVPEPASLGLLGIVGAGMLLSRRRSSPKPSALAA